MSQLNSILALKLQRQQMQEQQAREDNMRADASVQAAVERLMTGQQQLAQQQIARDQLHLNTLKEKTKTELGRQKQQFEYKKWEAEITKDEAIAAYNRARAEEPERFHAPATNINLSAGQENQHRRWLVGRVSKHASARISRYRADENEIDKVLSTGSAFTVSARLRQLGITNRDEAIAMKARLAANVKALEHEQRQAHSLSSMGIPLDVAMAKSDEAMARINGVGGASSISPQQQQFLPGASDSVMGPPTASTQVGMTGGLPSAPASSGFDANSDVVNQFFPQATSDK